MVKYMSNSINSKLLENLSDDMIELLASNKEYEVNTYDSVIQIIYNDNDYENKNVVPKMLNKSPLFAVNSKSITPSSI